ncbi:dihydrolipoamide acetyltransferase family protein [Pseudokineococcus sp. 5B2Z-1]|uniref:dihydrolipoamide acetyltransferase family protein n=1 Tax=Pseudokineococcus sp. 5B2Z-1 TaxID=3132744 RepID=UPI0030A7620A
MAVQHFRLPDVGEGLTEAEVVAWRVAVGDEVATNAVLVEIETAKSLVELPSPFAGVVRELLVDEGRTVEVGTPIVAVEVAGADGEGDGEGGDGERRDVLVGYGPGKRTSRRRRPAAAAGADGGSAPGPEAAADAPSAPAAPAPAASGARADLPAEPPAAAVDPAPTAASSAAPARPLAAPPVRKLARERGVDLAEVRATGPRGTVSRADVLGHLDAAADAAAAAPSSGVPGQEQRVPVRGVRRAMAEAMVRSSTEAPQATLFHTLDVTRTMKLVARVKQDERFVGVRVSPLLLAARAVVLALGRTPEMGARWDGDAQELVLPAGVHLGVAAATPRGLVVPVVRDAHALDLLELARALGELTATAREGRTAPEAMTGGSFTITNIGSLGIEAGAPLLNPGQTGILALGSVAQRPWVHKGRVRPRWTTTLGLTVDHRVVDGAQAGRFLADVAAVLERPSQAVVWS